MNPVRTGYLEAAAIAVDLIRDRAVTERWQRPSALPQMRVSGLAGHLAAQLFNAAKVLAYDVPDEAPRSLLDHYAASAWIDADLDDDASVRVRRTGEELSAEGQEALAERVAVTLAELRRRLADEPADRIVHLPWGPWSLTLDDFVVTRMMEIVVHSDDLAASVDIATPAFPARVFDPVLDLLARLAVRRHGQSALIRALTRAERAPAAINAF
jgi:hypothetical protein